MSPVIARPVVALLLVTVIVEVVLPSVPKITCAAIISSRTVTVLFMVIAPPSFSVRVWVPVGGKKPKGVCGASPRRARQRCKGQAFARYSCPVVSAGGGRVISACSIETALADKREQSISGRKRPGRRWSCNRQVLIACHHRLDGRAQSARRRRGLESGG